MANRAHELLAVDCAAPKLDGNCSKLKITTNQYKFVPYGCLRDEDVMNLIFGDASHRPYPQLQGACASL